MSDEIFKHKDFGLATVPNEVLKYRLHKYQKMDNLFLFAVIYLYVGMHYHTSKNIKVIQ